MTLFCRCGPQVTWESIGYFVFWNRWSCRSFSEVTESTLSPTIARTFGKECLCYAGHSGICMWYQHIITSIATEESCFSRFFVLGFIFFCRKSFRLSNPKIQLRDCGLVIDKKSRWPQDCERGFAIDHYFSPASCVSSVSSPQAQASDGKCKQKHLNFIMYLMYAGPIVQFPMNLTCKLIQGVTRCN